MPTGYVPTVWVAGVTPLSAANMNTAETQAAVSESRGAGGTLTPAIVRYKIPGWYTGGLTGPGAALGAGVIYYVPIYVAEDTTYIRIGMEVWNGVAGTIDLRIFNWAAGLPGTQVLSAGNINSGAAGWQELVIAQALTRGLYFLAYRPTAAPQMINFLASNAITCPVDGIAATWNCYVSRVIMTVTAAMADPAPAPTGTAEFANTAMISMRDN